jgi:hypothetical protein
MNPNDFYGWYLFFANQGKYTFKNKESEKIEMSIVANSYDEAKELLVKFIQNEEETMGEISG